MYPVIKYFSGISLLWLQYILLGRNWSSYYIRFLQVRIEESEVAKSVNQSIEVNFYFSFYNEWVEALNQLCKKELGDEKNKM